MSLLKLVCSRISLCTLTACSSYWNFIIHAFKEYGISIRSTTLYSYLSPPLSLWTHPLSPLRSRSRQGACSYPSRPCISRLGDGGNLIATQIKFVMFTFKWNSLTTPSSREWYKWSHSTSWRKYKIVSTETPPLFSTLKLAPRKWFRRLVCFKAGSTPSLSRSPHRLFR